MLTIDAGISLHRLSGAVVDNPVVRKYIVHGGRAQYKHSFEKYTYHATNIVKLSTKLYESLNHTNTAKTKQII